MGEGPAASEGGMAELANSMMSSAWNEGWEVVGAVVELGFVRRHCLVWCRRCR